MDQRFDQYFYLILAITVLFFGWTLLGYHQAKSFQPQAPDKVQPNQYNFDKTVKSFPLSRYQLLFNGDLFFGQSKEVATTQVPAVSAPPLQFVSQLMVLGITRAVNGKAATALVAKKTAEEETVIVKVGSVVEGEKILKIQDGYLIVKNSTGAGKVFLQE